MGGRRRRRSTCAFAPTATKGRSIRRPIRPQLVARRRAEVAAAGAILGVKPITGWASATASSKTTGSCGPGWSPWCGTCAPTRWWRPTRRPSTSGSTTSITGITGWSAGPFWTPWPRRPPTRTTSPRPAPPTRWGRSTCRARSSRTCGSTSPRPSTSRRRPSPAIPARSGESGEWLRGAVRQRAEDAGRGRRSLCRGLPAGPAGLKAAGRDTGKTGWAIGVRRRPALADCGGAAGPGDEDHPPRRHGRLLRRRGGPRRPGAGRPAGDRRRHGPAGRSGVLQLRGPGLRGAFGHALRSGLASCARRPCSSPAASTAMPR